LRPITCDCVLGRILRDFKWPEMVLDLQFEGSAVGVCSVALLVVFWYSPRVLAESASPELELAGIGNLTVAVDNFELRLGHVLPVSGGAGNVPLSRLTFEVESDENVSLPVFHK